MRTIPLLPAALLVGLLAGAARAESEAAPAVRVAALVPFVAEALDRMPQRAQVVARVRRDPRDAITEGCLDLGSPHAPSFEKLAEAHASLVIGERALHVALEEKIARLGAEVMLVDGSSVEGTLAGLVEIGKRVGASDEMAREVAGVRASLDRVAHPRSLDVLALFGTPGSLLVITEHGWLGDLLARLGLKNLGAGLSQTARIPGYVALSDEVLAGLHPEIVLLVSHGDPAAVRAALEQRVHERGLWQGQGAPAPRIQALDAGLFGANPGLRIAEAASQLVGLTDASAGRAP
jgi:iron complex transport system substrate-binding protein